MPATTHRGTRGSSVRFGWFSSSGGPSSTGSPARVKCGARALPERMAQKRRRNDRPSRVANSLAAAALATGGALGVACGSATGEPLGSASRTIAGGQADVAHHNVFLLVAAHEETSSLCTATLLAPNLLITARHCVSPSSQDDVLCGDAVLGEPYPASSLFTTNDPRPRETSPVFRAREVRVPARGTDTCGYDIALVLLTRNVPESTAVPAVPRIDREVEPGEAYVAVGYGVDERGDATGHRMVLRDLNVACRPGTCGSGVESTEFRGEGGICSGDSGGPAFDADGKVVGVVSRGGPNCSTPIYGTVTAWRDFIVDTAKEAAEIGGYEPAFWVTTGLSDPPVSPVGAGGAGGADGGGTGEACTAGSCAAGLVCHSASGEPGDATCVAECSATSECGEGLACESVGELSLCVAPVVPGDEGGCSMGSASTRGSSNGWWLLALAAPFAFLRRNRKLERRFRGTAVLWS